MTSNTLTDREALYCLCHVPGFGGVTIRGLKDTFGTCLSAWRVKPQELQKSGVLTERRAEAAAFSSRESEAIGKNPHGGRSLPAWHRRTSASSRNATRTIRPGFFHIKIARQPSL